MEGTSMSATVPVGSQITLVVSKGAPPTPPSSYAAVPDLAGMHQGDALSRIQSLGLTAEVSAVSSRSIGKGRITSQWPLPGESAPHGSRLVLSVSEGAPADDAVMATLPNVVGQTEADATARLQVARIATQVTHEHSATVPAGIVMAQVPNATTSEKATSRAWLWIGIAVALAVVLGAIAAFFLLGGGGETVMVAVPDLAGMDQNTASTTLEASGLKLGSVDTTISDAVAAGTVVAQNPTAGTQAEQGSKVDIVVSGGVETVEVPDVVDVSQSRAERALKDAGLVPAVTEQPNDSIQKGNVISQTPGAGTSVQVGSTVGIVVSSGPAAADSVTIPNVKGKSEADSKAALEAAGLEATFVEVFDDTTAAGIAVAQLPAAGDQVAPGTTIGVAISKGPDPGSADATVPDLIGKTRAEAATALQGAALLVEFIEQPGTGAPRDQVVGQWPAKDASIPEGSVVLVLVSDGT